MLDILPHLLRWHDAGTPFAVATVVGVRGSAPRQPGAVMAVSGTGEAVGSVSGGCVEAAVYEAAAEAVTTGRPSLQTFGYGDEDAFAAGLTCGGALDVLVRRAAAPVPGRLLLDSLQGGRPVAVATVTGGAAPLGAVRVVWQAQEEGTLGDPGLDAAVTEDARALLAMGGTRAGHYGARGQRRVDDVNVFIQAYAPPPRMLVFGAIDYAAATARIGAFLGYRVTVCDARPVFATADRFPEAHEVVCAWPHDYLAAQDDLDGRTVICVLTHDPKFDVPLLLAALRTPALYLGAMGSRRTHDDRMARLREAGVTEEQLDRIASPIGLDLGARTPEETAVSIAAEIVQRRWNGTARPLRELTGAIHAPGRHALLAVG